MPTRLMYFLCPNTGMLLSCTSLTSPKPLHPHTPCCTYLEGLLRRLFCCLPGMLCCS
jgi:hypothetical protein